MQGDNERVCLFAHHDPTGGVQPYVLFYLRALRDAGYRVHVARSDGRRASAATVALFDATDALLHQRPNAGLDFGAWQHLIRQGVADDAAEVLLANDSVFGPFRPLATVRRDMLGFDVWGMISSREGRRHLQSWFVSMTGDAFRRPAVRRVFAMPFDEMSKTEIIVHGELGLSAAFEAEALDVGARHVEQVRLRPSALLPTNPAHFRWRSLVLSGAVPFIKLELLRDNPAGVIGTGAWRRVVGPLGGVGPDEAMLGTALLPRPGGTERPPRPGWRSAALHLALHEHPVVALRDAWRSRRP